MAELNVAGYQATLQALSEARAQLERAVPASLAMHRYAAAVLANNPDREPALQALLQLHVDQTPGAVMPHHLPPPSESPPSSHGRYLVLLAFTTLLAQMGDDAHVAKMRRTVALDDIIRQARDALDLADRIADCLRAAA